MRLQCSLAVAFESDGCLCGDDATALISAGRIIQQSIQQTGRDEPTRTTPSRTARWTSRDILSAIGDALDSSVRSTRQPPPLHTSARRIIVAVKQLAPHIYPFALAHLPIRPQEIDDEINTERGQRRLCPDYGRFAIESLRPTGGSTRPDLSEDAKIPAADKSRTSGRSPRFAAPRKCQQPGLLPWLSGVGGGTPPGTSWGMTHRSPRSAVT